MTVSQKMLMVNPFTDTASLFAPLTSMTKLVFDEVAFIHVKTNSP